MSEVKIKRYGHLDVNTHPSGGDWYIVKVFCQTPRWTSSRGVDIDTIQWSYLWKSGKWNKTVGDGDNGYPGMYATEEEAQEVLNKYKDELL